MNIEIIMKNNRSSPVFAARKIEHDKMLQIFLKYGFKAHLDYIETIDGILSILNSKDYDLILCALDHVTENYGDDIISHNVHTIFEHNNVNYIGSSPDIIERVLSKSALKDKWQQQGIRTPPYVIIGHSEIDLKIGLKKLKTIDAFPYILKPEDLGNSRGIDDASIVRNAVELRRGLARLRTRYAGAILAEHYLGVYSDAMEITCAMIGGAGMMRLMPAQVVLAHSKKHRPITTEDKDQNRTYLQPLSPELRAEVIDFARRAFEVSGVRDYARGDFFYADGKLWAIEINGQPMVPDRWFAGAAEFDGLTEEQYLVGIIGAGYRRLRAEGRILTPFPEAATELIKGVM